MKALSVIAFVLVVIGGINWGLVGLFDFNLVSYLGTTLEKIVYVLVGLSAILLIFARKGLCPNCSASSAPQM